MKHAKKDNFYYLMHDILSGFPNNFEDNFLGIINHHFIAKEATRQIFKEEIKEKKPSFNILMGCLIMQNSFISRLPEVAVYEVIEVCAELDYCFRKDKRITIKKISSAIILSLFFALYLEFIIILSRDEEGKEIVNKFKKFFSKADLISIINKDPYRTQRIMQRQRLDAGLLNEMGEKLKRYLDEFYK